MIICGSWQRSELWDFLAYEIFPAAGIYSRPMHTSCVSICVDHAASRETALCKLLNCSRF